MDANLQLGGQSNPNPKYLLLPGVIRDMIHQSRQKTTTCANSNNTGTGSWYQPKENMANRKAELKLDR